MGGVYQELGGGGGLSLPVMILLGAMGGGSPPMGGNVKYWNTLALRPIIVPVTRNQIAPILSFPLRKCFLPPETLLQLNTKWIRRGERIFLAPS